MSHNKSEVKNNLPIIISAAGVLIFLFVTVSFSFKDSLFNNLFPKSPASAAGIHDITSPSVAIISPLSGAVINRAGTVNIIVKASDNIGVANVEFFANNISICSIKKPPYNCVWNDLRASVANYRLKVRADDASGNSAFAVITVLSGE